MLLPLAHNFQFGLETALPISEFMGQVSFRLDITYTFACPFIQKHQRDFGLYRAQMGLIFQCKTDTASPWFCLCRSACAHRERYSCPNMSQRVYFFPALPQIVTFWTQLRLLGCLLSGFLLRDSRPIAQSRADFEQLEQVNWGVKWCFDACGSFVYIIFCLFLFFTIIVCVFSFSFLFKMWFCYIFVIYSIFSSFFKFNILSLSLCMYVCFYICFSSGLGRKGGN